MHVVVPLSGVESRPAVVAFDEGGAVVLVLENEMDVAALRALTHALGQLDQEGFGSIVENRMDGVEAEPVEVEFLDPVERIVNEEFTHLLDARVDGRAPWRVVPVGEGLRRNNMDVGAFRTEMIVDDVKQHHEAGRMGGGDEGLQVLRAAIGIGRCEWQYAVITPVPPAGESGDRHDLDGGDAEVSQVAQLADGRAKRAVRGEGANVQLVDDRLLPWAADPTVVVPDIGGRVHDYAGAVHVLRLLARCGIRNAHAVRQDEAIAHARMGIVGHQLVPAVVAGAHGMAQVALVQFDQNGLMRRRP